MMQEEVIRMPYPDKDKLFIHATNKTYLADFELAIIYYWTGEYEKAQEHALKVKSMSGVFESVYKQNDENLKFINQKLEGKRSGRNDIIYVSMFTENTPYQEEVKILKSSLDKFGLPYEIVGLKNQGSWEKNTQMKPQVLKSVLDKYNKDVIWIDADAEILEKPELFYSLNCDLSFHHLREWDEKMTGTMYFKNNILSREVLNKWIQLNNTNDLPDADNFQKVMETQRGAKIVDLPVEYIHVADIKFLQCSKPVIIHHQASRRFKEGVNTSKSDFTEPDVIRMELLKCVNGHKGCSVIGNGPFKTNLSKQIDKSFVIRCNGFKLGYPEIGSRTDLNIVSLHESSIPDHKVEYPILGVLPISDTMYQSYSDAKQMHKFWLENGERQISMGNTVWMYGDSEKFSEVFLSVVKEINAFPTVGIMGIAIARWMGFKKIIISGFTFFQTSKSHYFKDEVVKPSMHHNTIAERELLLKWICEDSDTEYILDKLVKENLMIDASVRSNSIK
jgi:hypothetical protein